MDIYEQHLQQAADHGAEVIHDELPDGCGDALLIEYDGQTVILVDSRLDEFERISALAHEIAHLERGGGADFVGATQLWRPVVARDEKATDEHAAARLVPPEVLSRWADAQAEIGVAVGPGEVAVEFGVTVRMAKAALRNLTRWERRYGRIALHKHRTSVTRRGQ